MSDDPKLSQRYRELPREEPPRALDEAILAASRRAVHRRRRWYMPVAAAAVIVLAVAVVVHMDRERPDSDLVTSSGKILQAPSSSHAEKRRAEAARPEATTPQVPGAAAGPRRAPPPASAPAAREEQNDVATSRAPAAGARRDREADSLARMQVQRAPEQWLQGIADLRRQGRDEDADRELAQFRKQYPDYRLSDEMKAKVERK